MVQVLKVGKKKINKTSSKKVDSTVLQKRVDQLNSEKLNLLIENEDLKREVEILRREKLKGVDMFHI